MHACADQLVLLLLPLLQLELLVHLLEVTGPALDKTTSLLSLVRRMSPIDKTNYMGKVTLFTKPKGTVGMQPDSIILGKKLFPGSPFNNGAPPAPLPPPVPAFPRTLSTPSTVPTGSSSSSSMSTGANTGRSGAVPVTANTVSRMRSGAGTGGSSSSSNTRVGAPDNTQSGFHAPRATNGRQL
jgi:hypothetical protein